MKVSDTATNLVCEPLHRQRVFPLSVSHSIYGKGGEWKIRNLHFDSKITNIVFTTLFSPAFLLGLIADGIVNNYCGNKESVFEFLL